MANNINSTTPSSKTGFRFNLNKENAANAYAFPLTYGYLNKDDVLAELRNQGLTDIADYLAGTAAPTLQNTSTQPTYPSIGRLDKAQEGLSVVKVPSGEEIQKYVKPTIESKVKEQLPSSYREALNKKRLLEEAGDSARAKEEFNNYLIKASNTINFNYYSPIEKEYERFLDGPNTAEFQVQNTNIDYLQQAENAVVNSFENNNSYIADYYDIVKSGDMLKMSEDGKSSYDAQYPDDSEYIHNNPTIYRLRTLNNISSYLYGADTLAEAIVKIAKEERRELTEDEKFLVEHFNGLSINEMFKAASTKGKKTAQDLNLAQANKKLLDYLMNSLEEKLINTLYSDIKQEFIGRHIPEGLMGVAEAKTALTHELANTDYGGFWSNFAMQGIVGTVAEFTADLQDAGNAFNMWANRSVGLTPTPEGGKADKVNNKQRNRANSVLNHSSNSHYDDIVNYVSEGTGDLTTSSSKKIMQDKLKYNENEWRGLIAGVSPEFLEENQYDMNEQDLAELYIKFIGDMQAGGQSYAQGQLLDNLYEKRMGAMSAWEKGRRIVGGFAQDMLGTPFAYAEMLITHNPIQTLMSASKSLYKGVSEGVNKDGFWGIFSGLGNGLEDYVLNWMADYSNTWGAKYSQTGAALSSSQDRLLSLGINTNALPRKPGTEEDFLSWATAGDFLQTLGFAASFAISNGTLGLAGKYINAASKVTKLGKVGRKFFKMWDVAHHAATPFVSAFIMDLGYGSSNIYSNMQEALKNVYRISAVDKNGNYSIDYTDEFKAKAENRYQKEMNNGVAPIDRNQAYLQYAQEYLNESKMWALRNGTLTTLTTMIPDVIGNFSFNRIFFSERAFQSGKNAWRAIGKKFTDNRISSAIASSKLGTSVGKMYNSMKRTPKPPTSQYYSGKGKGTFQAKASENKSKFRSERFTDAEGKAKYRIVANNATLLEVSADAIRALKGGFWSNYFQDIFVAFGNGMYSDAMDQYFDQKFNKVVDVMDYSYGHIFEQMAVKGLHAFGEYTSFRDGLFGAAAPIFFSMAPDIATYQYNRKKGKGHIASALKALNFRAIGWELLSGKGVKTENLLRQKFAAQINDTLKERGYDWITHAASLMPAVEVNAGLTRFNTETNQYEASTALTHLDELTNAVSYLYQIRDTELGQGTLQVLQERAQRREITQDDIDRILEKRNTVYNEVEQRMSTLDPNLSEEERRARRAEFVKEAKQNHGYTAAEEAIANDYDASETYIRDREVKKLEDKRTALEVLNELTANAIDMANIYKDVSKVTDEALAKYGRGVDPLAVQAFSSYHVKKRALARMLDVQKKHLEALRKSLKERIADEDIPGIEKLPVSKGTVILAQLAGSPATVEKYLAEAQKKKQQLTEDIKYYAKKRRKAIKDEDKELKAKYESKLAELAFEQGKVNKVLSRLLSAKEIADRLPESKEGESPKMPVITAKDMLDLDNESLYAMLTETDTYVLPSLSKGIDEEGIPVSYTYEQMEEIEKIRSTMGKEFYDFFNQYIINRSTYDIMNLTDELSDDAFGIAMEKSQAARVRVAREMYMESFKGRLSDIVREAGLNDDAITDEAYSKVVSAVSDLKDRAREEFDGENQLIGLNSMLKKMCPNFYEKYTATITAAIRTKTEVDSYNNSDHQKIIFNTLVDYATKKLGMGVDTSDLIQIVEDLYTKIKDNPEEQDKLYRHLRYEVDGKYLRYSGIKGTTTMIKKMKDISTQVKASILKGRENKAANTETSSNQSLIESVSRSNEIETKEARKARLDEEHFWRETVGPIAQTYFNDTEGVKTFLEIFGIHNAPTLEALTTLQEVFKTAFTLKTKDDIKNYIKNEIKKRCQKIQNEATIVTPQYNENGIWIGETSELSYTESQQKTSQFLVRVMAKLGNPNNLNALRKITFSNYDSRMDRTEGVTGQNSSSYYISTMYDETLPAPVRNVLALHSRSLGFMSSRYNNKNKPVFFIYNDAVTKQVADADPNFNPETQTPIFAAIAVPDGVTLSSEYETVKINDRTYLIVGALPESGKESMYHNGARPSNNSIKVREKMKGKMNLDAPEDTYKIVTDTDGDTRMFTHVFIDSRTEIDGTAPKEKIRTSSEMSLPLAFELQGKNIVYDPNHVTNSNNSQGSKQRVTIARVEQTTNDEGKTLSEVTDKKSFNSRTKGFAQVLENIISILTNPALKTSDEVAYFNRASSILNNGAVDNTEHEGKKCALANYIYVQGGFKYGMDYDSAGNIYLTIKNPDGTALTGARWCIVGKDAVDANTILQDIADINEGRDQAIACWQIWGGNFNRSNLSKNARNEVKTDSDGYMHHNTYIKQCIEDGILLASPYKDKPIIRIEPIMNLADQEAAGIQYSIDAEGNIKATPIAPDDAFTGKPLQSESVPSTLDAYIDKVKDALAKLKSKVPGLHIRIPENTLEKIDKGFARLKVIYMAKHTNKSIETVKKRKDEGHYTGTTTIAALVNDDAVDKTNIEGLKEQIDKNNKKFFSDASLLGAFSGDCADAAVRAYFNSSLQAQIQKDGYKAFLKICKGKNGEQLLSESSAKDLFRICENIKEAFRLRGWTIVSAEGICTVDEKIQSGNDNLGKYIGEIDLLVQDSVGEFHLVDIKTSGSTTLSPETLNQYTIGQSTYRLDISRNTGGNIKIPESNLHLLVIPRAHLNEAYKVSPQRDARGKVESKKISLKDPDMSIFNPDADGGFAILDIQANNEKALEAINLRRRLAGVEVEEENNTTSPTGTTEVPIEKEEGPQEPEGNEGPIDDGSMDPLKDLNIDNPADRNLKTIAVSMNYNVSVSVGSFPGSEIKSVTCNATSKTDPSVSVIVSIDVTESEASKILLSTDPTAAAKDLIKQYLFDKYSKGNTRDKTLPRLEVAREWATRTGWTGDLNVLQKTFKIGEIPAIKLAEELGFPPEKPGTFEPPTTPPTGPTTPINSTGSTGSIENTGETGGKDKPKGKGKRLRGGKTTNINPHNIEAMVIGAFSIFEQIFHTCL